MHIYIYIYIYIYIRYDKRDLPRRLLKETGDNIRNASKLLRAAELDVTGFLLYVAVPKNAGCCRSTVTPRRQ